jgi:nickel-dependent lactate racemase
MDVKYYLNSGPDKKYYFSLPSGWSPVCFVESKGEVPASSVAEMTLAALTRPVGTSALARLAEKARRIAIVVDDVTRPTPVREILEVLLSQLEGLGKGPDEISIVVACGTHVAMERSALETRLGDRTLAIYRVVQHNAWQPDLVPIDAGNGQVVMVNPVVVEADLKIGVSSILPHPMAGYGGGPKILMPGVCGIDFIMQHHMKNTVHPNARSGRTEANPFHKECMRIARLIGLDLSINCVYDQEGRLGRIIAGSLEAAFAAAIEACYQQLGFRWKEKVDVTLVSSYPHSHGIQFYKGLDVADTITRAEGAILLFAPLASPIPGPFIREFGRVKEKAGADAAAYVTDIMSQGEPFLINQSAEFNMAMSVAIRRPQIRTVLVSPLVSNEAASLLGFEYVSTVEEGITLLKEAYPQARVAIFPSGGLTIPIRSEER